jgi:hypothetical protein
MPETFRVPVGSDFAAAYNQHRLDFPGHEFVTAVEVPANIATGTPAELVVITRNAGHETASEQH